MTQPNEPILCVMCGQMFTRQRRPGNPAVTCSPECRAARKRQSARARYVASAEENRVKARLWYQANREYANEQGRERYRRNIEREREGARRRYWENRDHVRDVQRRWREANPERKRELYRRWLESNSEHARDYIQAWREANTDKTRQYHDRRRALQHAAHVHDVTAAMVWEYNPAGPCCNYCRKELTFEARSEWHIDHAIPLSRGGLHEIGNLVIACVRCNLSKGAKLLGEWKPAA